MRRSNRFVHAHIPEKWIPVFRKGNAPTQGC
jgi:hypothetical protein